MKQKLIFDTTSAATIEDSDSVGAFLRSSDGTLLSHTDISGKKALDVNVANVPSVDVDLDYTTDSVTAYQGGTWVIESIDNDVTVVATDLDIRNLNHTQDSIEVRQSTHDNLNANVNLQVGEVDVSNSNPVPVSDGGGSLTVDASDLDIRDLSAAQDSVASWMRDGAGIALTSTLVGSKQGLDVSLLNDPALANSAVAAARNLLNAANVAEDVVASPLANRKYLFLYNNDNRTLYVGQSGVTETTGFPLPPGARLDLRAGASIDIEWVSSKLNHDLRTLELS